MLRPDYKQYIDYLQSRGVDRLYHVTSRANWDSIRKVGLYSVGLLKDRGILGYHTYSDTISRLCDESIGAHRYIHLSFSPNPVFLETGKKAGTIDDDYIVLEISVDVLKDGDTEFANMNLHHHDVIRGGSMEVLQALNIEAATAHDRNLVRPGDRIFCQAEILVQGNIAPELILNRKDIDNLVYDIKLGDSFKRTPIILLIDQIVTMGDRFVMNGEVYPSVSNAIEIFVNKFLTQVAMSFHNGGNPQNLYDVAVLGTSDNGVVPLWNPKRMDVFKTHDYKADPFVSAEELYQIFTGNLFGGEKNWIHTEHTAWKGSLIDCLQSVKGYIQEWLDRNSSNNNPPVVVFMTEGGHIKYEAQAFVKACSEIRSLQTKVGNTVLWQIEYSPFHSDSLALPTDIDVQGLDPTGHFMYQQSSELRDIHNPLIEELASNKDMTSPHRAMAVNIDMNILTPLILGRTSED